MMKRFFHVLLMVLLLWGPTSVEAAHDADYEGRVFLADYTQTLYDDEGVIPVSEVNTILQTSDGYLWFGGYQGLMRYNGIDTRVYTPEDGFPSFNVNVLYEDAAGQLWIGTNNGGIVRYRDNGFTIFELTEGLPSSLVRDIAEDEAGNIYVATAAGLAVISADDIVTVWSDCQNLLLTHLEYIGENQFIGLLNDGEIILLAGGKIQKRFDKDYFGEAQPTSLFVSAGSDVYIGTMDDTLYLTNRQLSSHQTITIPGRLTLNCVYQDHDGRTWIGADNGIGYLSEGTFVPVTGIEISNSIECIYQDYEGSFWLGSSRQGLLQLTPGKFQNISFIAQLPDYTVNTTAFYQDCLYIGADEGLIVLQDNEPVENELTEMLKDIRIRSIFVDSQNELWICTYEKYGVLHVKPDGSYVSINSTNGLSSDKTRCVIERADGSIAIGMSGGVSLIRDNQVVKSYGTNEGLLNDVILSLCEDESGVLYAGSDGGGIYAIDGDKITCYTEKDGLGAGVILRMAWIDGKLFISTGNSLCYLAAGKIAMLEKLSAYDDNVFDLQAVGADIWFLHTKGINVCSLKNLMSEAELEITQWRRSDGLAASITANSWNQIAADGTMYISTGKGVQSISTLPQTKNAEPSQIVISDIYVDGEAIDLQSEIKIPRRAKRVDIYIALLSYTSTDGVLNYRLEGFEDEYKTMNRNEATKISYTNLKGGKYNFYLSGVDGSGSMSEELSLELYKEPTFLEMPLVRLLLILLFLGALFLSIRAFIIYRTKKLVKQHQEYKNITGQVISVMADTIDSRSEYTRGHSHRVAEYSKLVGQRMGLSEEELRILNYAALLHDIGKVSMPDSIIEKKGRLSEEEFQIVKDHSFVSDELLHSITIDGEISVGAKYHHERVDGTGYPHGLAGNEIPLIARIISVCNAYDSMLSDRPYRKALTLETMYSELIHNAGKQFDEKITAVLIALIEEGVLKP